MMRPLQNRVDPFGALIRTPARGSWMGNRGLLHDSHQAIRRDWRLKAWLICTLRFKDRHRTVMSPGLYTELFFLDEATALAAGHRPCAECRRQSYLAFKAKAGFGDTRVAAMDAVLHSQRMGHGGEKLVYQPEAAGLPDGSLVALRGSPWLIWRGSLHRWSPEGYGEARPIPRGLVEVLTPRLTIDVIRRGYAPQVALG